MSKCRLREIIIGTLVSISMVGIPMGDPQFLTNADPDTVNNKIKYDFHQFR